MTSVAEVRLWGRTIGAVSLGDGDEVAAFEYAADFSGSMIEVAPITMPLSMRVYSFPELSRETFYGLPGLLADSLPDKFGNALIDAWLATQGRQPGLSMQLSACAIPAGAAWAHWSLLLI